MGADAVIRAVVDQITDEQKKALKDASINYSIGNYTGGQGRVGTYQVDVTLYEHYFGPEYPRGNWPELYHVIRQLRTIFPGGEVQYSSDYFYDTVYINKETEHELIPFWDAWINKQLKAHTTAIQEIKDGAE